MQNEILEAQLALNYVLCAVVYIVQISIKNSPCVMNIIIMSYNYILLWMTITPLYFPLLCTILIVFISIYDLMSIHPPFMYPFNYLFISMYDLMPI